MQFTILALAAASLVVATPMPPIDANAYPVVVTNVGVANAALYPRAKGNAPAPLRVGSNDSFQTNSCNGASFAYVDSDHPLISVSSSSSC